MSLRPLLVASLLFPASALAAGAMTPTASLSGKSDPECLAPFTVADAAPATQVKFGKLTAEVKGSKLKLTGKPDGDKKVSIGVIAAVNEATPNNLKNLDRYLAFFKKKGVELILVPGDSGASVDHIDAVLRQIGSAGLPVIAFSGNQEHKPEFIAAVSAVNKAMPNVINGQKVRMIEWDDATIVTLPGHFDPRFLHREGSCQYFTEDLDALAAAVAAAPQPVILAAHSSPLGKADGALDVVNGENVGDANLTSLIEKTKINFGIFPNIKEAGGVATGDVAGSQVLKPNKPSDKVYLNPGAADSLAWRMNDGSQSFGSVAVFTVNNGKGSYEVFKAPEPGSKAAAK